MPSTPSTSDDEPIEGVVISPLLDEYIWQREVKPPSYHFMVDESGIYTPDGQRVFLGFDCSAEGIVIAASTSDGIFIIE